MAEELLRDLGLRGIVITLGPGGMAVKEREGPFDLIPTAAREVYDVTGAGDTAAAALGLGIGAGLELRTAARLANCAAGVAVGKLGTAQVTREELLEFLASWG